MTRFFICYAILTRYLQNRPPMHKKSIFTETPRLGSDFVPNISKSFQVLTIPLLPQTFASQPPNHHDTPVTVSSYTAHSSLSAVSFPPPTLADPPPKQRGQLHYPLEPTHPVHSRASTPINPKPQHTDFPGSSAPVAPTKTSYQNCVEVPLLDQIVRRTLHARKP